MIKSAFWHFGIGLLLNVILGILAAVFYLIFGSIFARFTGFVFPAIVTHVLGIVAVIIGILISLEFIKKYSDPLTFYGNIWYKKITNGKKTKVYVAQLCLLPFLAISVVLFYFAIKLYPTVLNLEVSDHSMVKWILCVELSLSAIFWLIYWFVYMMHYFMATCKCGNVMSYIAIRREDYHAGTHIDSKTKDGYGTIGEVYVNDSKVGEVKGNTGTYTLKREVFSARWTAVCQCAFCGRERKIKDGYSHIVKNWH